MARPFVVHCKHDRHDVYIGRPSKSGNPFVVGRDGDRAEVLARYERWLADQPELLDSLGELAGKTLWLLVRAAGLSRRGPRAPRGRGGDRERPRRRRSADDGGVAEAEVYVYDQAFERLDGFESGERAARGGRLGVWGASAGTVTVRADRAG